MWTTRRVTVLLMTVRLLCSVFAMRQVVSKGCCKMI